MWEAWFARDIPVSEGPYKFYGLPGLILLVRDTHDHYAFALRGLDLNPAPFVVSVNEQSPIADSPSAPMISKAKFLRTKHNDDLTLMDRMISAGNKIPESWQRDYYAELKRRNNPLERK